MKKISLLIMSLFFVGSTFAQNGTPTLTKTPNRSLPLVVNSTPQIQSVFQNQGAMNHSCGSHEINEKHYLDRGILNEYNLSYQQSTSHVVVPPSAKTPGVNTISVIFHVVHNPNNPAENVTNAKIMAIFNEIQQDFSLNNPDVINARTGLGFTPADANINFCLATQTPAGVPLAELGVVRVATTEGWYDSNSGEENKMKSAATGGSTIWNRNNYLNIWICDISNGASSGTAGYAYRPTTSYLPSSAIDGIVIDYNLGVNNAHVTSHEIGHYLGLDHTWGGSGGCGNDDGFADTPNTAGPSFNFPGSCSGSQSTCSSIATQYENFMDYANCTCMFTQNQADYMLLVLTGIRSSLLLSPGCNPVNAPPVVSFTADIPNPIIIPVGGSVNFTDLSTNAPTSWLWTFGGGAANSTVKNPSVTFNTAGTFTVKLNATNAYGTGTLTKTAHVQVVTAASGTGCDTLRNYNPASPFGVLGGVTGYLTGNENFSGQNVLEWAEPYTSATTTTVRRLQFAVARASDGGGSITFKVYANNAGIPGAVLASQSVPISDFTVAAWNEVDFATPATVTGNFFVGYAVSYANTLDTFALYTNYELALSPVNYTFLKTTAYGWEEVSDVYVSGPNSVGTSYLMDVMTSNGAAPVANVTLSDTLVCAGGNIVANGSGSTNTTNYYWYKTDNPITTIISTSGSSAPTFAFPTAGNFALILYADGSCMTDAYAQSITVKAKVTATVTPTASSCGVNNGKIVITNPLGGNSPNYKYSINGSTYTTSATFNNLAPGTYTVYIKTGENGCEKTYSVTIGTSTAFVATISPNTSICAGASTSITASGGVSYQWFDGVTALGTTATISVSPAASNQFECVVTNSAGCQSTVYTNVNVIALPSTPIITASGATTICSGTSVDLTSSSTLNNVWSTTETDQTITVNSSGTYTVKYTNAEGCVSPLATVVVTVSPTPVIAAGTIVNPTTCSTTTGTIQVTGTGSGIVTWSGTASGNSGTVTLPFTIPSLAAGSYNVTFANATGCVSNTLNQALTDPTPPATPIITAGGAVTFCSGNSVTLTSSQATGNVWSTGATGSSIVVSTAGTYSVTYTNGVGCSASSTPVVVVVNNNPTAPSITPTGSTTFCSGGSVLLTSSQSTNNLWSNAATTNAITVSTSGSYTVTYTNANGCSTTSAPVSVTVTPAPAAPTATASGSTSFCAGQTVDLTSSVATGNTWSTGETTQTITVNASGTYSVTITSGGCSSVASNAITVTANPLPTIIAGNAQSVCAGTMVTLTATGGTSYVWTPTVGNGTPFNPPAGTTTYTVVGTDANGCENTSSVDVTVSPVPTVNLASFPVSCINHPAFALTGGTPAGGVYSGTGVNAGSFDPSTGVATYTITYTFTAAGCSNSATSTITVDGCAGIEDQVKLDLLVFPNPTKESITISLDGDFEFTLTDMQGKVIAKDKGANSIQVNTSGLADGVYFVEVATQFSKEVVKITKQN